MQYKPLRLHPGIETVFTSVENGSIAAGGSKPDTDEFKQRREDIVAANFGSPDHVKLLIQYSDQMTYSSIERIERTGNYEVICDAAYTTVPGIVIALPVADCSATLVYDPVTRMLGVLHLGRHSSVAGLIEHFIIEVADTLGSDPRDWCIWMSPSLKQPHDRMEYFTPLHPDEWTDFMKRQADGSTLINVDGHNTQRFVRAGVQRDNITVAPQDTYTDTQYFSKRASDEQHDPTRNGRMMLAASLIRKKPIS